MATISSLGAGSGLDIRQIVDDLVAAERAPAEQRLNLREQRAETQLSALGQVQSAVGQFSSAVSDVRQGFDTRSVSSSDDAIDATLTGDADPGSMDISVEQLAETQSIASGLSVESRDEPLGEGQLTFRFGDVDIDVNGEVAGFEQNASRSSVTIDIDAENNTLEGVRDAVNEAGMGVRASIVNDGNQDRLIFTGEDAGAENGFVVDVDSDDPEAELQALAFNEDAANATVNREAQNALLTVDGLSVSRSSNEIDDLIDGVSLSLNGVTSAPAQVEVTEDSSEAAAAIEEFIEAFNTMQGEIRELSSFDPETEESGPLQGNSLVRGLTSQIRNALTEPLDALEGRSVRSLADVGILTTRDGSLELDGDRLREALVEDPDAVEALFTRSGIAEGDQFDFAGASSATEDGQYDVEVTEAATRGSVTTDTLPDFPFEVEQGDNSLQVLVDGLLSDPITLDPGTYDDADALASALQAAINSDPALRDSGREVRVNVDNDALVIESATYGSSSEVEFSNVADGLAALGLEDGTAQIGVDVQGTIGGNAATGDGLQLTGDSGPTQGLRVDIEPGAEGNLGMLAFTNGVTGSINSILDGYQGPGGLLNNATSNLNNTLERVGQERERLDERMERTEQRFVREFSAMDAMVAQLQQSGNFLQQQLANLNNN